MKLALVIVCLATGTGAAEGTHVHAPAGWTAAPDQARALSEKTNALSHFGGAPSMATSEVFVAPAPGAALYVTTVVAKITEGRDGAARAEVDSVLDAPKRAQLTSDKVSVDSTSSIVDPKTKQIDVVAKYRDESAGLTTNSRMLVVADAEALVAVIGECTLATDVPAAIADACASALATLDTGIAVGKRVDLALAVYAPSPPASTSQRSSTPSMSDGTRTPLPPMVVPGGETKRTADRRPVYVGLGIVVLAAVFWWNRRRRERLEEKQTDGR